MSIERALVVSSWPDCSGFPASGPYAKKKALPTDDDALVRAARHSLRLRKICHEQNNILSSFFLFFFLFSFSGWIFRSGSGGTRWSYGIYVYIYRCSVRFYWLRCIGQLDEIVTRFYIRYLLVFIFVDDGSFEDRKNAQKQQPVTKDYKRL